MRWPAWASAAPRRAQTVLLPSACSADVTSTRRGSSIGESLAGLGSDLGPNGAPLTDALHQAGSAGVPLVPLLDGVAAAARDRRRRTAPEAARRLPVTMLLPLVACTLPAAILLAVVPVLVVSLASLRP